MPVMRRPLLALGLGLATAILMGATPGHAASGPDADHEPHCGDGKRAPAAAICAAFESAEKLAANDPIALKVTAVWRRVEGPVSALTGRATALSLLAPSARHDGRPFAPAAYICPGAPPTVYVPHTLIEKIYGSAPTYNEDFLGFVLGHELGHRVNDFSADGCQLGAFERPGRGLAEEQLADFRGAFFAAVGGYSTRTLAKKQTVSAFLESEFKVRERVRDERHTALLKALERFDAYEGLYDAGLALAFGGEPMAAARLLDWADELIEGDGVPLPEIKVVRALARMMEAAPDAPWLEAFDGTGHDLSDLRCRAIFATHTPLAEELGTTRVRSTDERARARKNLELANRLFARAAELGADPLVTSSGRACVSFYLGDHVEAARWHARAERRIGKNTPPAVKVAAAANQALFELLAHVGKDPVPPPSDPNAKAWAQRLTAKMPVFMTHPELGQAVSRLASYPAPARTPRTNKAMSCKGTKPTERMPEPPAITGPVGQCPAGWTLGWTLPPADALARSGSSMGVTGCVNESGERLMRVKLAAAHEPPMPMTDTAVREHRKVPAGLSKLDAWICGCDGVEPVGVSDTGATVYQAACPDLGVPLGVIEVGRSGQVERVSALLSP